MKNFNDWNNIKQNIDTRIESENPKDIIYYSERDIVWISCGLNVGIESDGKGELYMRPAVILRKLNKNHYIVLFCTTTEKVHPYYFKINSNHESLKNTKIILSQVKTIDKKRIVERLVTLSENDFLEIKNKFIEILVNSPSLLHEGVANARK